MDDTAFLDSAYPLFQEHLAELWRLAEQPRAMYARGSAILPKSTLVHEPWDMDFVLFVSTNEELTARMATLTMDKIRKCASALPPPDIRIVHDDCAWPESLFALLLVSDGARLLFGEDHRLPITFFPVHSHTIWQYALKISRSRLESFVNCSNPSEQKRRAPHLAKSVLRLGGLLNLQKGGFSRQPEECAVWLSNLSPQLDDDIFQLMHCLETVVDPNIIAESCRRILPVIKRAFLNDQLRT